MVKSLFCPKKLKKTNLGSTISCFFCLFEALRYPFLKSGAFYILSHFSIIFYFTFLLVWKLFLLQHYQTCTWSCFLLMVTMFIELVLWACNFDVISNQRMGTYWSLHIIRVVYILSHKIIEIKKCQNWEPNFLSLTCTWLMTSYPEAPNQMCSSKHLFRKLISESICGRAYTW